MEDNNTLAGKLKCCLEVCTDVKHGMLAKRTFIDGWKRSKSEEGRRIFGSVHGLSCDIN